MKKRLTIEFCGCIAERTQGRACAAAYDVQNFKAFVYVRNKTKVGSIPASLHALSGCGRL
jgi:hypothetical protein